MFASDPLGGLGGLLAGLERLDQDVSDQTRVDRIRLMEEAKAALSAAQATEAVALAASQRAEALAAGEPADRADRGIAAQIALALRVSHWYARRYLGWARVLTSELPNTFAALRAGVTTEHRAMIVARETIWLSREDRLAVDAELAPRLGQLGDGRVEAEAKKIAYRLDPHGYVARAKAAASDRRVGVRPAPDCMSRFTGLGPVAQGVAMYAALNREADAAIAAGDPRGRGQIMYDILVERVTGQTHASDVPIELNLVMTDQGATNSGPGANEPAILEGYGPLPAPLGRDLILNHEQAPVWIRRMLTAPESGELIAMESRRREFTPAQRRFLRLRDQRCRTPWCDAPIRHADHVLPAERGGPTAIDNGQGLCEACNHAKQARGWRTEVVSRAGPHEVEIVTPTGHRYRSRAPDPPRAA